MRAGGIAERLKCDFCFAESGCVISAPFSAEILALCLRARAFSTFCCSRLKCSYVTRSHTREYECRVLSGSVRCYFKVMLVLGYH